MCMVVTCEASPGRLRLPPRGRRQRDYVQDGVCAVAPSVMLLVCRLPASGVSGCFCVFESAIRLGEVTFAGGCNSPRMCQSNRLIKYRCHIFPMIQFIQTESDPPDLVIGEAIFFFHYRINYPSRTFDVCVAWMLYPHI